MAKKIWKNHISKFESRLQKEISLKLSKKLINEYGVLLQQESNTFNINNKKRIDFILSKIDKYLFIELKTSKDPRIYKDKLEKQLKNYNDSYNLIKIKLLIILENHNPKQKTKENVIKIAKANDFDTHFIKII